MAVLRTCQSDIDYLTYGAAPATARPIALATFPVLAPRVGRFLLHPLEVAAVEEEAEAAASSALVVSLMLLSMLVEVVLVSVVLEVISPPIPPSAPPVMELVPA